MVYIDQWYPSSKTCSRCGYVLESLDLSVRQWRCPSCERVNGRDENAALNIKTIGASTVGLGDVRLAVPAISACLQNPTDSICGSISMLILNALKVFYKIMYGGVDL